jgi:hypothetical protein
MSPSRYSIFIAWSEADLEFFSMSQAGNAISFLGAGGPSGKPGFSLDQKAGHDQGANSFS